MLLAVACCAALLMLAACSSDSNNAKNTATPGPPQASPIPRGALPTVVGRDVISTSKGYRATFPENWEPHFNLVNTPTQKLDSYFAPEAQSSDFRATISISCEAIDPSAGAQQFFDGKVAVARQFAQGTPVAVEQPSISGISAYRVQYTQKVQSGASIAKVDVFTANKGCGYTISLASSPDKLAENLGAFNEFIGSLVLQ